ncbi:disulfide bond formation protein B [Falsiroseomonas sp. HW251]|uniref:disulfide bond formation protein B n=1 Tax=Falsiroseomonas sp. HW251 TaxID=3390998 RepID=UPI003D324496
MLSARLDHLFQLGVLAVLVGVLSAALVMQFAFGELPCPLCLLERVAMFGVGFAVVQNFRNGFNERMTGLALIFAVVLLVIATRQSMLDIEPRPGHAYIGSAVLGLHMPVWAAVIGLVLILAHALKITLLGAAARDVAPLPLLAVAGRVLGLALLALCAINFIAVLLQCGAGECHTFGYRLLS